MARVSSLVCLTALLISGQVLGQYLNQKTCSKSNSATIQPDATAWLGGILSLSKTGSDGYGCGTSEGFMQSFEAIRWVLELLNKKNETLQTQFLTDFYVPGIKLGMKVINYCNNEKTAVAALAEVFPELVNTDDSCNEQTNGLNLGIIGASRSGDTIPLADAAEAFDIPVISYQATVPELTGSGQHPNFMRTVSPDGPLMDVIVKILTKLQWSYIAVVYDAGTFGSSGYKVLHERLVSAGICLTTAIRVNADDDQSADDTINKLINTKATGVIYIGPVSYTTSLIQHGNKKMPASDKLQWIYLEVNQDAPYEPTTTYQRGSLFVSAASRFIVEFEDHWIRINESNPSKENPWFTKWYEDTYGCKFNAGVTEKDCRSIYAGMSEIEKETVKRKKYQQDQYVEAAVMSVYTYAYALRKAQIDRCGNTPGICLALRSLSRKDFYTNYIKKVNFTFTAEERVPSLASNNVPPYNAAKQLGFFTNGDVSDPSYYIWNFNDKETGSGDSSFKYRRVGAYINGYLDFNLDNVRMYSNNRTTALNPLPSSLCPSSGCSPCLGLPSDIKYYYEPGDIVVNGIFSLHNTGTMPLTCGTLMSANHAMFLEAMIYAIKKANDDPNILRSVKLGGLGMDDCRDGALGQTLLAQVQRGNLLITDSSGKALDPRTIEAYSAAYNVPLTLPLAEAMNMLMKPMVGYRAIGSELDDKTKYPYYIRALPGNVDEIKALILLLKNLNWMYVQAVVSDLHYSQDSLQLFRELGAKAGICIVATHNVGSTQQQLNGALAGLQANLVTPVTVILLEPDDIRRLLAALGDNIPLRTSLALVSTSKWGNDPDIVKGLESVADGSITLNLYPSSLASFQAYLSGLNANSYTLNPWFKEWFQAAYNCSSSLQAGSGVCDLSKSIVNGTNFRLIYQVESVINAITAIAKGLHNTLVMYCGVNYNTVCTAFLNAPEKGARFLEEIKKVTFTIEDKPSAYSTFSFMDGSAVVPFEIYNFRRTGYVKIGDVNPWTQTLSPSPLANTLTLYGGALTSSVQPECQEPCLQCLYMLNYLTYWYIPGDVVLGAIFDIHLAGNGPFSCGAIRRYNGAFYTEVFDFALKKINSRTASVKLNVTLGGLAFDGCTNPTRASTIVNLVHTGMPIKDGAGNQLSMNQLVSWMTFDSQTTIDSATLLQKLNMPIVSPGATSSLLDNKQDFYTFFRTIPSDSVVVKGMAQFIKSMGWKYVIALNAPDPTSRQSRDLFRKSLESYGICIVDTYEFNTDGTPEVILNSIIQGSTRVVAVFSEPDQYIENFLSTKARIYNTINLMFVANRQWGQAAKSHPNQVQSAVFFDLNQPNINEFLTFLSGKDALTNSNPWFKEMLQDLKSCNLNGSYKYQTSCLKSYITYGEWDQDIWTLSTINAVYALANGVHKTLVDKCGANYGSVCARFLYGSNVTDLIMRNMDADNFMDIGNLIFKFLEREADRLYSFMKYKLTGEPDTSPLGQLNKIGDLTLIDQAAVINSYKSIPSACSGECLVCNLASAGIQDLTMTTGQFYIIGLFDVHKQGSTPFSCGEINGKHGLQLLEAFHFALEYVNNKTGIFQGKLNGAQIGGIGLDMCKSPARAAELVSNIHSERLKLKKDGKTVGVRDIDAYVAAMDTDSSTRVADILTQLAVPQISYGATGMDLLNRNKYSYFLRSVPADDKQSRAIVSYLKKFNYNNIQVITSFDEIGEPGEKEFKRLSYVNKICITTDYLVGETGDIQAESPGVISQIKSRMDAQVVVLWMKNPLPLLEAASADIDVSSKFLFIATDKWGADTDYLNNPKLYQLLFYRNLVILDVETADIPAYDKYLDKKNPSNYKFNPWFQDYFEMLQNCYWDSQSGTRGTKCDTSTSIPRASNYVQDRYVLYVINAVFSAALGIHNALESVCGPNYTSVCTKFYYSGERRQKILEGLLKVNFTDDTHQPFFFTEDGQSDRGFHFYNVTHSSLAYVSNNQPENLRFQNVGSYNDTHFLKLDISYSTMFRAQCDAPRTDPNINDCICLFPTRQPSRFMNQSNGDRGLSVVYVGDIHMTSPTKPMTCGPINTGLELYKLLAFFYAIDRVNLNVDGSLQDSVKLDGLALDGCSQNIRPGQDVYNILSGNQLCDSDVKGTIISPSSIVAFVIDLDRNTIPVARILSNENITSISPTAGSSLLSDRYLFPYFLRTRADNLQFANIVYQLAQNIDWDYLSVLYSDSLAYQTASDSLLDSSQAAGACVGNAVPLSTNATLADAQEALKSLSQQVGAKAVVLFVSLEHLQLLMQASRTLGLAGRFVWIVPYDWTSDSTLLVDLEQEMVGSFIIEPRSAFVEDFKQYIKEQLSWKNRNSGKIPTDWWQEIYSTVHKCNILDTENPTNVIYTQICTGTEVLDDLSIPQDSTILHVMISVLSIAQGLSSLCNNQNLDVAACLQLLPNRNQDIYNYIAKVNFKVLPELLKDKTFNFNFDSYKSGYVIKNYQVSSGALNPYIALEIGQYTNNGLNLSKLNYAAGNLYNKGEIPSSACAQGTQCTCQLPDGNTWTYEPISLVDSSSVKVNGKYIDPKTGQQVQVTSIPGITDRFPQAWAVILSVIAATGAAVSLALFLYLLIMYPVRGGTSILGYILSFGIILLYLMVFPFIAHAEERICGLRRFALGLVYAIVYSALMVKLVDCFRVRAKNDVYNAKYSKMGRPFGLFLVTFFFVLVQVIINTEWLILEAPTVEYIFYNSMYWPRCSPDDFYDEGLVLSLVYIMVIIFMSLIIGLFTYSSNKNHREARWILGILILSVPCWVIWCAVSILGAIKVRDAAVAVGLIVNATVMLALVPIRKLYLLHSYNKMLKKEEAEEARSQIPESNRGYTMYDNKPVLHDAGSVRGSNVYSSAGQ